MKGKAPELKNVFFVIHHVGTDINSLSWRCCSWTFPLFGNVKGKTRYQSNYNFLEIVNNKQMGYLYFSSCIVFSQNNELQNVEWNIPDCCSCVYFVSLQNKRKKSQKRAIGSITFKKRINNSFIASEELKPRSLLSKQPLIKRLRPTEIKKGDLYLHLSLCFSDICKTVLQPSKQHRNIQ